ncbi:hypothetical protein VTL71DRAFT_12930 [Oculimacula yallundae]|uniref:BTB domain-containing protein n=1 Tax=Oculimacula yallundae TaxID=86028 RepID=A0ABR4CPC5_9HELO
MASTQIIDPNGDLILVLKAASTATAEEPEPEAENTQRAAKRAKTNRRSRPRIASPKVPEVLAVSEVQSLRMQVSSKHVQLASPVFKAMLGRGFAEGEALRENGQVEIPLPEDDPVVFATLMNIIYGKSCLVPRKVDVTQLAHLAATVDKYQFQEAVGFHSDAWIANSKNERW